MSLSTDVKGATRTLKLKVSDILNLEQGLRVVVEFGEQLAPYGEAAGLLAGVCGMMAIKTDTFPISFAKWSDMPEDYFKDCWNDIFEVKLCFFSTWIIV